MRGRVIWITGLPGSGKSTIAEAMKKGYPDFFILRMDDLRRIATPNPTYTAEERDIVYRSLVYLAKVLSDLGHGVIIDATGNLRKWRDLARHLIPLFSEVYLKCSLDECGKREEQRGETHGAPRAIYRKGREGWPVPGITAPYEEPLAPEITIDTERTNVKRAAEIILNFVKHRSIAEQDEDRKPSGPGVKG